MEVTRCVCFDVTFAHLREVVERDDAGFDELQRRYQCGRGCGLCVPYIRKMIETGRTSFPIETGEST